MRTVRALSVSPRLELFFALAAVLSGGEVGAQPDGARRWLDQARRRLDQSFRRRLGDRAQSPEFWRHLATLPLSRQAAISPDVDGVIEALAALPPEHFRPAPDPEALQLLVLDALRRFDGLAFAAYWRPWREELAADEHRLKARLDDFSIDTKATSVIFLPSRFTPPGFSAVIEGSGAILLPVDPDRLPPVSASAVAASRRTMSIPRDPA